MRSSLRDRVIELLKQYQGSYVPQSYIHRSLSASKSRVSEILSELEREGLIHRVSVGRSKIIYIHPGLSEKIPEKKERIIRLGIVYSSEYLFLKEFADKLREEGLGLEVVVFRDGLVATRALAEGFVDAALSPLPGQLYLYPAYRTFEISLAGVRGGVRVVYAGEPGPVYSSMISTMDYARHMVLAMKLVESEETIYYRDPSEIRGISRGYIVTWHPLYIELEKKGGRIIFDTDDLGVEFCCVLGISKTLSESVRRIVERVYRSSLESYKRDPEKGIEYYSMITGIEREVLKSASREYVVAEDLDKRVVSKIINTFAPVIPSRTIFQEALTEISRES